MVKFNAFSGSQHYLQFMYNYSLLSQTMQKLEWRDYLLFTVMQQQSKKFSVIYKVYVTTSKTKSFGAYSLLITDGTIAP